MSGKFVPFECAHMNFPPLKGLQRPVYSTSKWARGRIFQFLHCWKWKTKHILNNVQSSNNLNVLSQRAPHRGLTVMETSDTDQPKHKEGLLGRARVLVYTEILWFNLLQWENSTFKLEMHSSFDDYNTLLHSLLHSLYTKLNSFGCTESLWQPNIKL